PQAVTLGRLDEGGRHVYERDHAAHSATAQARWLLSTIVAGTLGVALIGFVVMRESDQTEQAAMIAALQQLRDDPMLVGETNDTTASRALQLRRAARKTGQLETTTRGVSTLNIIHDTHRARRFERDYITIKPYGLIEARLATQLSAKPKQIPKFNAFKLVANDGAARGRKRLSRERPQVSVKVVELVGGILPAEDGAQLSVADIVKLVSRGSIIAGAGTQPVEGGSGAQSGGSAQPATGRQDAQSASAAQRTARILAPRTTELIKNIFAPEPTAGAPRVDRRIIRVARGDTVYGILLREGVEPSQIKLILSAARRIFPELALVIGDAVQVDLDDERDEFGGAVLNRLAIFSAGQVHRVTVLNEANGYQAYDTPKGLLANLQKPADAAAGNRASLYEAIYEASLLQNLRQPMITQILRKHVFDTDFKRRVGPGDAINIFFDLSDAAPGEEGKPQELLYSSLLVGGRKNAFYRFRLPNGVIDYYDQDGKSAKKFLMKQPVRDPRVRFTSGYGYRMHPILGERRLHTGVDFAGPVGTKILAAGNGTVTTAGWRGAYGKSVIIAHANGYETTYSHLSKIAKNMKVGARVRQGDVIGRMGSTGRSTGSHLHYEIKLNGKFLNPSTIPVPRGRVLRGPALRTFRRERDRIDELMRRTPVRTRVAQAKADGKT
ncbi:MAG: M23 family metallopeptidase, partial [Pseudomonadota bacterium]